MLQIQKMNQVQRPYTDAQTPISFLSMHPSQEQLAVKGESCLDGPLTDSMGSCEKHSQIH